MIRAADPFDVAVAHDRRFAGVALVDHLHSEPVRVGEAVEVDLLVLVTVRWPARPSARGVDRLATDERPFADVRADGARRRSVAALLDDDVGEGTRLDGRTATHERRPRSVEVDAITGSHEPRLARGRERVLAIAQHPGGAVERTRPRPAHGFETAVALGEEHPVHAFEKSAWFGMRDGGLPMTSATSFWSDSGIDDAPWSGVSVPST